MTTPLDQAALEKARDEFARVIGLEGMVPLRVDHDAIEAAIRAYLDATQGWRPIPKEGPPRPEIQYLVTNNIGARDAHGQMSHVWKCHIIKSSNTEPHNQGRGRWTGFDDGDRQLWDLTHYCEVPQPSPPPVQPTEKGDD